MKSWILSLSCCLFFLSVVGQETFPVNGVHDERLETHAFVDATIYASPDSGLQSATMLVKEGKVIAIGRGFTIPDDAVVHACEGLVIYPSFIDPYAGFNAPNKKDKKTSASSKAATKVNTASNWNPAIHPELIYEAPFPVSKKVKEDWLSSGIGIVNVHHQDGVMRGGSALFHLGIDNPNEAMIERDFIEHFSFNKGSSKEDYPSSHIGAIALLRQTFYDAQWYNQADDKKELNPSLKDLAQISDQTSIFDLGHPQSIRNVKDLSAEIGVPFIMKGTGKEYLMQGDLDKADRIIIPLNFPEAFDLEDPYEARSVSLGQLKHWEAAPFNAYFLHQNGLQPALTRDTIKSGKAYLKSIQKLFETGLSHSEVLAMLTQAPAEFLGIQSRFGSLQPGMEADFFIANKRLDEKGFQILAHWNRGKEVYQKQAPSSDLIGKYNLVIEEKDFELLIEEVSDKKITASAKTKAEDIEFKTKVEYQREVVTLVLINDSLSQIFRMTGKISLEGGVWDGKGQKENGDWFAWAAVKDRDDVPSMPEQPSQKDSLSVPSLWMPNIAYGLDSVDTAMTYVVTNATVWTCADTGILESAAIWVEGGKIKAVGSGMLFPTDLKRIDAKGKHVTPGIIDEHSHIAIRGGVNEWAQSSSAEVRISDAVDPWNIHIYRHLAGGVTAAQLLHGSANPIGGQSALIKMKWGGTADDLLIDDADGFIKFALGENVKRSNSKDPKGRFPLTRMGVEQTFVDAFTRARSYHSLKAPDQAPKKTFFQRFEKPLSLSSERKDLELEVLAEILNQERFITCHSYVQSEILMLMQVADSFGFQVNTFTHILEGYKVADKMREHGVTGSTFSDWWAYKFEVNDAIPYNAALMTKAGVNTAINSDDAEMGRRLNQEAAKTMKYGGLSEEDAMKLVTINPAKALHLDERVGSIEVGKDADFVIWSGHPLSVYTKAEKTFIEGKKYFDINHQPKLEKRNELERARLISLMVKDKSKKKQKIKPETQKDFHCDTILENYWNE